MKLNYLSAHKLKKMLKSKEISCRDIARSIFSRIEDIDEDINAYIRVEKESALKAADKIDGKISAGENIDDFTGIPIGIKDNI
ncbi:MAG TPA: Asp-tRNA(Asn)/Glu-tRNA(Gln) amidotransferase GatCAB subunit A, partial [Actinobacteria bacterium]|nr:Asp-tRNA(Asn)/Glu-tRNA(Gln) amidotransferase GatCAB subunit A [Actinomycetota bacterium]